MSGTDVALRFTSDATVDTPLRGVQAVDDWIVDERAWLAAGSAQVRPLNHIVTDTHASAEYVLALSLDGSDVELPVHLVAELDGDKICALRAYHSTYPLTGEHIVRAPMVAPNPDLEPGAPVDAYEEAMRAGDPAANGLLDAVRIYDDVSPPPELFE